MPFVLRVANVAMNMLTAGRAYRCISCNLLELKARDVL